MKALLITRDGRLQTEIAALVAARVPPIYLDATCTCLREALEQAPALTATPLLIIVDADHSDAAEPGMLERLCKCYPAASLLLLTGQQQQDLLIRAMRAGVREVLPLPLVQRAFDEVLDRLASRNEVADVRDGKVLAFISCKGGSGATFISTNFGYALSTLADKKVLLIDLHGQFGDATLYVSDQKPVMTLHDVCSQIARIDAPFLASCLVQVAPGYGVLAAADDAAQAGNLKAEQMEVILRLARLHYDFIVLDVGRQIDAMSLRALDNADAIYPVLQLALPDLRDGRRLIDIFRSLGYPMEHIRLIVNRYEKNAKLRLQDVQVALGVSVLHTIANDYLAVTESVNQGVPVLKLSRSSAVARSLTELVELVTTRRVAENKGLFDRLFGRAEPGL